MSRTSIEWTDAVWNPVTGCTKVSAGCKNCYAEGVADRFWAKQYPSTVVDVDGAKIERPRRFTDVRTHADRLDDPLHWRKPRCVFVNSMSDLFHEAVPDEFIDRVFAVMHLCAPSVQRLDVGGFVQQPPAHIFQILTKRPQRMRDYMLTAPKRCGWSLDPTPPSIWLGVSCEDQRAADERIPLLLQTPAAVRFLSCEPLLSRVDLSRWLHDGRREGVLGAGGTGPLSGGAGRGRDLAPRALDQRWQGVGAPLHEADASGHEQRSAWQLPACDVQGRRATQEGVSTQDHLDGREPQTDSSGDGDQPHQRRQAEQPRDQPGAGHATAERAALPREAGTRFGNPTRDKSLNGYVALLRDRKGGDQAEWPYDLRVRQFPEARR